MIENIPPGADKGEEAKVAVAKAGPGLAHLQRKTNGETEARFTSRPTGELPHDVTESGSAGEPRTFDASATDVAVLPDEPSVWEARPAGEGD